MFFDNFPITYFQTDSTTQVVVTDFLKAVKLDPVLTSNSLYYNVYNAQDNDTAEIISHKFYKSTQYHWVIMLLNQKFDPDRDFPKDEDTLIAYANRYYTDIDAIHHYEDSNGNWVDNITTAGIPITNIEYVRELNEAKRPTKILNQELLSEFVQQYYSLISTPNSSS